LVETGQKGQNWSELVEKKWLKTGQIVTLIKNGEKLLKTGQKWSKIRQKLWKLVETGRKIR
jgi:hypothetical protein